MFAFGKFNVDVIAFRYEHHLFVFGEDKTRSGAMCGDFVGFLITGQARSARAVTLQLSSVREEGSAAEATSFSAALSLRWLLLSSASLAARAT